MADEREVKALLEVLLLVASEPLTPRRAAGVLGVTEGTVRAGFAKLAEEYRQRDGGLEIIEVGGGWRLTSKPEYDAVVRRLEPSRSRPPLSTAAVETLAVIAWRQPATRLDVEAVRGVRCEGVLATLLDRGLIQEIGRKDGPGRPILYGTTRYFLECFGLRDLGELPPLPDAGKEEGPPSG